MIITNTQNIGLGLPTKGSPTELAPGENDVDGDVWNSIKDHHVVGIWLSEGMIEVVGEGKATPLVEQIEKVKPAEKAVALIEGCKSLELLKTWNKRAKRAGVKKAIAARMKELSLGG